MYVTLNLILESLDQYAYRDYTGPDKSLRFERLCLLPETPARPEPGRLYVGDLSDAVSFRAESGKFFCVCIHSCKECLTHDEKADHIQGAKTDFIFDGKTESTHDRKTDPTEKEDLYSGLIIIDENISCRKIFSELSELFYTIGEWTGRMKDCAYEKKTLQEMLDLSEPVIGNFISVSDSALSLICSTKNIATDDPVSVRLLENGFHPEETIDLFRRQGLFERWDNAEDIIIDKSRAFSPYDICSRIFKLQNTYYIHAVMICGSRPLTPGLADLFRMLTDALELYIGCDWQQHTFTPHDYDRFLIELIEDRAGIPAVVESRARHLGIAVQSRYRLCLIDFKTLKKLPVGRIGIELSRLIPEALVTVYRNRILLLLSISREDEYGPGQEESLSGWLENYDASCAVSSLFTGICETGKAYEQTRLIFLYQDRLLNMPFSGQQKQSRIMDFDSCFHIILPGENPENRAMWRMTRSRRMLKKISDYDEKHGTNNLHLLYTYLFCGCSATESGAILHMHRNNVLYRIGRIEEMMGKELSDKKFRYELLSAGAFLQLYGV